MDTEPIKKIKQNTTMEDSKGEFIEYEYAGYQIRVHFTGERTLIACIEDLLKRELEV